MRNSIISGKCKVRINVVNAFINRRCLYYYETPLTKAGNFTFFPLKKSNGNE